MKSASPELVRLLAASIEEATPTNRNKGELPLREAVLFRHRTRHLLGRTLTVSGILFAVIITGAQLLK